MVKSVKDVPAGELVYRDVVIHRGKDGMVNLTDMWKAQGSPANKDPSQWTRLRTTRELETVLGESMGISQTFRKRIGRGLGTWAHPLMAVSYAKYLSPEFHIWANQVILERIEERRDPELGMSRARERAI